MNLAISFRSYQSNRELGNEVVNFTPNFVRKFTPNFVGKWTSSLREKFPSFGEIVSEFLYTLWLGRLGITSSSTVFVDMRLWKTKHPGKRLQSCVLLTDWIEIHQLQPLVWPANLLYVMLSGCDWRISIRSVNNTQDWWKFWKRFRGCSVFQSRISTKTVIRVLYI